MKTLASLAIVIAGTSAAWLTAAISETGPAALWIAFAGLAIDRVAMVALQQRRMRERVGKHDARLSAIEAQMAIVLKSVGAQNDSTKT